MLMDTRQLAAFCAVVERRSFSLAAERLGVTQPAGSLQVKALEEQLLEDVAAADRGSLGGTLDIGASTGPGAHLVPLLLCEFQQKHPDLGVALTISDTQTVIERVAGRALGLGVVGALRRHRSLEFEPLARDEIVLAVPPGHPAAGGSLSVEELRAETLIVMQEGAGVRQVVEEELRRAGLPAHERLA